MFVRRRPLLRAAVVGGGAYMAGKRRGERSADAVPEQQSSQQASVSEQEGHQGEQMAGPAAGAAMSDQLAKLSSLHQQGSLTDEEFAAAKSKLLGG